MKIAACIALLAPILALASAWGHEYAAGSAPGANVESLLDYAREHNPDYAAMRLDAEAAGERGVSAGALPDPKFRTELWDITRMGEQDPALSPSRVGSAHYFLMQDLPWFGKRDLKREIAEFEAESAKGRSQGTWADLAARIKATYAELYYLRRNIRLNREILDLMQRLEKIAQVRYAGGLAAQQDVIRAQVEQTSLRTELVGLETEQHHLHARMNALLARPPGSPLADPERPRPVPAAARLDYAGLAERVAARNPQLAAEASRVKAAEKGRDLAYKNRYPDFTVGVSPVQYQNAVREWQLSVELNIPLQQSARRAQERESEALLAAAQARRESASNQVLADLAETLASLDAARQTEALATTSLLPQAELTFQSALAGYENGKVDFATLLDAQRQIRQGKLNQIRAEAEMQARLADIERLLGEDL